MTERLFTAGERLRAAQLNRLASAADTVTSLTTQVSTIDATVTGNSTSITTLESQVDVLETTVAAIPAAITAAVAAQAECIIIALSDETTAITTGDAKVTFYMPFAMTLTQFVIGVTTQSTSGVVTVDVNEAGTTILSTKASIDANENLSTTGTAAVISDSALAQWAKITFDVDAAGTGAKGLKAYMIGTRA